MNQKKIDIRWYFAFFIRERHDVNVENVRDLLVAPWSLTIHVVK